MSDVKTRFAPSPTGYMHIGNLRTALYSYLVARSLGGKFILRIEDTDRERLVENAVDVIYDTLKLARLKYDEGPNIGGPCGPYVQSDRKDIYKTYAEQLVQSGHAYYCFCTKERLTDLHDQGVSGYDRHCRTLTEEDIKANLDAGIPYVIRQKAPTAGTTSYIDKVFGEIAVENAELQDIVLMKADGYPTYNFAHVVDDHLMGITHVVRGSEYVTSTPSYALLYDAFGWERPTYIHLPLIMGKDAEGNVSKLSKRHGAVSFQDLVADGYLPEAIINYIALLGWNPKTEEEFFTLEELEQKFSADAINKSAAVFDFDKLLWFNGMYIRKLTPEQFLEKAQPYLKASLERPLDYAKIASLIQLRVEKLSQIPDHLGFFNAVPEYDLSLYENKKSKATRENALPVLEKALPILEELADWQNEPLYYALKSLADEMGLKANAIMWAVRVAITGVFATPGGATDILELLGKDESIARIKAAMEKLR